MIPLATTTVTVTAVTEAEPGEGTVDAVRAAGVRAVIGSPSGVEQPGPGGGQERVDAVLNSDPIAGMAHGDQVDDDTTGDRFRAVWVQQRHGLGVDHTRAGLVRTNGRVAA